LEIDNDAIGKRIREEREKLGLSREEFAEIIGLSDYYIGQLERGERQMSMPTLIKVANCLHVSLDYLVLGRLSFDAAYICDPNNNTYEAWDESFYEINNLLKKCSPHEIELFKKLIKTILPYISEN
jgi:transcriptional regulator with XRE-family HTH domain